MTGSRVKTTALKIKSAFLNQLIEVAALRTAVSKRNRPGCRTAYVDCGPGTRSNGEPTLRRLANMMPPFDLMPLPHDVHRGVGA